MINIPEPGELSESQLRAAELGGMPAFIEQFGIRGLYNHRNISLSSKYAATILIARNGTGKTTLMGALDAFLKLQLNRLRGLEFQEIYCKFRDYDRELILTREDLVDFLQVPESIGFTKLATRAEIEKEKLLSFLLSDFGSAIDSYYDDTNINSNILTALVRNFGSDLSTLKRSCTEEYIRLFERSSNMSTLYNVIKSVLGEYEIVYLPTYRRVELAITDEGDRKIPGRRRPRFNFNAVGLHTGDIQFGLGDISDRLSQLRNEILQSSNRAYREISENIINELISGYEVSESQELPKREDLRLFFSRLKSGRRYMGPYYSISSISAPDFEKIYTGEGVPAESRKFLTYFLGKLNNIIQITSEIERPVNDFVNSCNRYLSATEQPGDLGGPLSSGLQPVDAKALKVDRTDLSVNVVSVPARTPIALDALSSGEKQMVSLFAKMYLYPKRKIVLVDEPELSLSIDWQRGILVDILLSPHCEQVIAITHSPFVFDNSLEPFARTLGLTFIEQPQQENESDFSDEF